MIRWWAATAALMTLLIYLLAGFVGQVVLYDPMLDLEGGARQGESVMAQEKAYKRAWSRSILKKNLFSPQRSEGPPMREVIQNDIPYTRAAEAPVSMPSIDLNGIIKNPDGSYTAYLKIGSNQATAMRSGDMLEEVLVERIENRKVSIRWRDRTFTLELTSSPLMKKR